MSDNNEKPKLNSLIKLIPITVIASVFSQISILMYYSKFNFSVTPYIEIQEVLFSATRDFLIIGIIMVPLVQFLTIIVVKHQRKDRLNNIKFLRTNNIPKPIKKWTRYKIIDRIFLLFYIIAVCLYLIFKIEVLLGIFIIGIVDFFRRLLGILIGNFYNLSRGNRSYGTHLKSLFPYISFKNVAIVTVCVTGLIANSEIKASFIARHNPYLYSYLILENKEVIITTSKVILIGKTNNYYFFYNTPTGYVRVINRKDIAKEAMVWDNRNVPFFYRF